MKKPLLLLLLFILSLPLLSQRQYNLSGYISVKHISGSTYQATITNYSIGEPQDTNYCNGVTKQDTIRLYYGDGTSELLYRNNGKVYPPDSIPGGDTVCACHEVSIYSGNPAGHTFPGAGTYHIWYDVIGLGYNIVNIPASGGDDMYITNTLMVDPFAGDTIDTPTFPHAPVCTYGCMGECYYFNFSGIVTIGDSISYSTGNALVYGGAVAPGYFVPTGLVIDGRTGTVSWCNPTSSGIFDVAIYITTYARVIISGQISYRPLDTMETMLYVIINSACPTGINELNNTGGYSIYPNPSNDLVYINGTTEGNKTVTLYNVLGQAVLTKESDEEQIELSTIKLNAGVYFVNIKEQATGKSYTLKLIKE
jgi:hypothetical protein